MGQPHTLSLQICRTKTIVASQLYLSSRNSSGSPDKPLGDLNENQGFTFFQAIHHPRSILLAHQLDKEFDHILSPKPIEIFIYELPNKLVGVHNLMLIKIINFEIWTCRSYFAPALSRKNPINNFRGHSFPSTRPPSMFNPPLNQQS